VRAGSAAPEVETALWAWANFGGIGSRTRRGCGALFCSTFAPADVPEANWISGRLRAFDLPGGDPAWPRLAAEPIMRRTPQAPLAAWKYAVETLADFRQNSPVGRNPGFKRSHWPEADSLRARSGIANPDHKKSITVDAHAMPAFPRAELGLPYQVEFKEGLDVANNVHVNPEGSNRLASPVIIRPLAIGPKGERAVPMVLRLEGPLPTRVRVVPNDHPAFAVQPLVRNAALESYPGSPMKGRSTQGSALEAFLAFAGERFK
jgi:CRISPR-associated protein Cmr1